MTKETQFDFWKNERRTSDLYLRTNRQDWFDTLDLLVAQIGDAKRLVDLGSGDGHSTRQLLARLPGITFCDLVEPDPTAIEASAYLQGLHPVRFHPTTLQDFAKSGLRYDVAYAIHSQYHWGTNGPGTAHSSEQYARCLDSLTEMAPKVVIMGAPSDSDYYLLAQKNPFSDDVFTESIEAHYARRGHEVRRIPCNLRFYVADLFHDAFAAKEFWKFINYCEKEPSEEELSRFITDLGTIQKNGNITFKDELVVVERKRKETKRTL